MSRWDWCITDCNSVSIPLEWFFQIGVSLCQLLLSTTWCKLLPCEKKSFCDVQVIITVCICRHVSGLIQGHLPLPPQSWALAFCNAGSFSEILLGKGVLKAIKYSYFPQVFLFWMNSTRSLCSPCVLRYLNINRVCSLNSEHMCTCLWYGCGDGMVQHAPPPTAATSILTTHSQNCL